jgi:hypothetical protein
MRDYYFTKVVGFVHESLRINTNRAFWYFALGHTNRIHKTNLLKTGLQNESTNQIFKVWTHESGFASPQIWICKDSFCVVVLRIGEALWGFIRFVKKGQIFWTLAGFVIYYSKLIFPSADLWTTIWNESGFIL